MNSNISTSWSVRITVRDLSKTQGRYGNPVLGYALCYLFSFLLSECQCHRSWTTEPGIISLRNIPRLPVIRIGVELVETNDANLQTIVVTILCFCSANCKAVWMVSCSSEFIQVLSKLVTRLDDILNKKSTTRSDFTHCNIHSDDHNQFVISNWSTSKA